LVRKKLTTVVGKYLVDFPPVGGDLGLLAVVIRVLEVVVRGLRQFPVVVGETVDGCVLASLGEGHEFAHLLALRALQLVLRTRVRKQLADCLVK